MRSSEILTFKQQQTLHPQAARFVEPPNKGACVVTDGVNRFNAAVEVVLLLAVPAASDIVGKDIEGRAPGVVLSELVKSRPDRICGVEASVDNVAVGACAWGIDSAGKWVRTANT